MYVILIFAQRMTACLSKVTRNTMNTICEKLRVDSKKKVFQRESEPLGSRERGIIFNHQGEVNLSFPLALFRLGQRRRYRREICLDGLVVLALIVVVDLGSLERNTASKVCLH